MREFPMVAKTFKGLEGVLAEELSDLGAKEVKIGNRAVSFSGDTALLYRANLCVRTALRILVPIATFQATNADEVYEGVRKIDWATYMDLQQTFSVESNVFSESFRNSRYVTYRVKDAIADWWTDKKGQRPNVRVTNPDVYINVHIAQKTVTVSLDSSGESLHKRGYRVATTQAPINEVLAAGLLLLAGWSGQCDFYDPMCGSGTLPIEAALIAKNIPANIYRSSFAFEKWLNFNAVLWEEIYNDDGNEQPFNHQIYASDASFYAIEASKKNIAQAALQKDIQLKQVRMEELKRDTTPAFVMLNPPYGERLQANKDIVDLYGRIGTTLKHTFAGSVAWIISANMEAMKAVGLKPMKKIPILNGELPCTFNQYELFAGEHKEWKKQRQNAVEK